MWGKIRLLQRSFTAPPSPDKAARHPDKVVHMLCFVALLKVFPVLQLAGSTVVECDPFK